MLQTMQSDESLILAAQQEDEQAIATLVERYAPHVLRFGLKLCRDAEDARDLVQDTFLTAVRELKNFRGNSRFSTWLYTIARSNCIKRRTRGDARLPLESLGQTPDTERALIAAEKPTDEQLAGMQLQQALELAIQDLDANQREVLLLRDMEGLTAPEVAEVLGLSVEAVKSRLHRARRALREHLLGIVWGDEPPASRSCPDIIDLLSRYQEGDVTPQACKQMEAHVAECETCRVRCNSLRQVLSACSSIPTPELPADLRETVMAQIRKSLRRTRNLGA